MWCGYGRKMLDCVWRLAVVRAKPPGPGARPRECNSLQELQREHTKTRPLFGRLNFERLRTFVVET